MAVLSSKILIFIAFLGVSIYGTKGRPNNLVDETTEEDEMNFEESDLLKKSKTRSGEQKKGTIYTFCFGKLEKGCCVLTISFKIDLILFWFL